jgi:inner membrane protein
MDPLTQGALGACCAQLILHNKFKSHAWQVGAIAGMAPDLDVLIYSPSQPLLSIEYHRHFTHSLFFIPFGALMVTILLLLIMPSLRKQIGLTYMAAFIGMGTHGILDACTSYGTLLYWPFSYKRISWDFISIIDPFFTTPLLLGVAWSVIMDDYRSLIIGFTLALCILAFNAYQHHRAFITLKHNINTPAQDIRLIPMLASSTHWRSLYKHDNFIQIAKITTPLFSAPKYHSMTKLALFNQKQLPYFVKHSKTLLNDYRIFNWFTDGYLHTTSQSPLQLIDARYLVTVRPLLALWGIEFNKGQKHIKKLRWIGQNNE